METRPLPAPERQLLTRVSQDYPNSEILMSFPDRWELIHRFKRGYTPLYIAGLPPSREPTRDNQFAGLSAEINRSLDTYRQYKLFEPQTAVQFNMAWDVGKGRGQIIGGRGLQVQLQQLGQAQIWKGEREAVIWECFFHENRCGGIDWLNELTIFWLAVERDMGVKRIFTEPHEPTFQEGYTDFLSRLGYAPNPDYERWWSKQMNSHQESGKYPPEKSTETRDKYL